MPYEKCRLCIYNYYYSTPFVVYIPRNPERLHFKHVKTDI